MGGMRYFSMALRSVTLAGLLLFPKAGAAESLRLLVIETTPKEATAIRKHLSAAEKGQEEVINAVLERKGTTLIADFREADAWRAEPMDLEKKNGELKIGGEVMQELGITGRLDGAKLDAVPTDLLQMRIALPAAGKAYRCLDIAGSAMMPKAGRWQERVRWSDAESTRMVWQYADFEAPTEEQKSPPHLRANQDCVRVEMEFFQAEDADLAKLALAKPENRGKALEWLRGRAKLPKECSFWMRPGERSMWTDLTIKVDLKDGKALTESDGISVDGGYTGSGDDLKVEWKLESTVKGEVAATQTLATTMKPDEWVFLPIKDFPGATVVASRLSRE